DGMTWPEVDVPRSTLEPGCLMAWFAASEAFPSSGAATWAAMSPSRRCGGPAIPTEAAGAPAILPWSCSDFESATAAVPTADPSSDFPPLHAANSIAAAANIAAFIYLALVSADYETPERDGLAHYNELQRRKTQTRDARSAGTSCWSGTLAWPTRRR